MTDLLIRDVRDGVIVAIDATATRLGSSRTEYARTELTAAAAEEVEAGGGTAP